MPITVRWRHLFLDPRTYNQAGTWRVARVQSRGFSFPTYPAAGYYAWESEHAAQWTPLREEEGLAPPTHELSDGVEVRTFYFRFWGIQMSTTTPADPTPSPVITPPQYTRTPTVGERRPDVTVSIDATAYYSYDWGGGPGSHAVQIDMFDDAAGVFLPYDFVEVVPDPDGSLTEAANKGLMLTDTVGEVQVTALDPAPRAQPDVAHEFKEWRSDDYLRQFYQELVPRPVGPNIPVRSNDIYVGVAHYTGNTITKTPPRREDPGEVLVPPEGVRILGGKAGGPLIVGPEGDVWGEGPGPVPPDEAYHEPEKPQ